MASWYNQCSKNLLRMGQIRYITISSEIYDGRLCYAKFLDNNNQTTDLGQQFLSFEFSTDADYGTCFVYVPSVDNTFVVNISEEICPTPTPTVTATVSPTPSITPSNTPTETPTSTPSETPTSTPTETPTNTPSETATQTPTNTETPTSTVTPTETETPTPTQTPTPTETPTPTVTQTPTPTETLTPTVTQTPTLTPFRNVIIQNNNSNGVDVASYASNFSQVFNFSFPIVYGETVNGFHYEIFSGDFITFGVTGGTEYVLNIFRNDELIDTSSYSSPYYYVYNFNTGFTENDLLKLVVENTILPTPTNTVTPTSTETPTPTTTNTETPTNTPTNTPTPSTTPSLVTSGLIIQLDANTAESYPGSGTTVVNMRTPGTYDHTLNGATFTTLDTIKCFDCRTGTQRVVVNGTGPTLPTTGYTYITWARLEPNPTGFRTLLYTNSPKYTPITVPNGTNTLGYWDTAFRSSGYDLSSQTSVWVQYAVVGTNSSQRFYINGSEVGSPIAFGAGGTTHWGWGNNDIVSQAWGYVANMYFYNRQLSLSEIQQQYDFLAPRFL